MDMDPIYRWVLTLNITIYKIYFVHPIEDGSVNRFEAKIMVVWFATTADSNLAEMNLRNQNDVKFLNVYDEYSGLGIAPLFNWELEQQNFIEYIGQYGYEPFVDLMNDHNIMQLLEILEDCTCIIPICMANDEGVLSRCIMLFRSFLGGESVGSVANGLYSSVVHRSANGMTISLSTEALVRVVEMEGWFVSASMKASTGDKFSAILLILLVLLPLLLLQLARHFH